MDAFIFLLSTAAFRPLQSSPPPPPVPSTLSFTLNSTPVSIHAKHATDLPKTTLLEYLRRNNLNGTKLACGTGACGACTVLVDELPVNACITPLCSLQGKAITTIEGLGDTGAPNEVQETMAKMHATQCGFCSPGIAMSLYAELLNNPTPTPESMERAVDGNLCRCTGYRPILDAAKALAHKQCVKAKCKTTCGEPEKDVEDAHKRGRTTGTWHTTTTEGKVAKAASDGESSRTDPTPPPPAATKPPPQQFLGADGSTYHRPTTLPSLLSLHLQHPTAHLVGGISDFTKHHRIHNSTFIDITGVPELSAVTLAPTTLTVGGAVPLAKIINVLTAATLTSTSTALSALSTSLSRVGTPQNRTALALGSHIYSQDVHPILLALSATITTPYGTFPITAAPPANKHPLILRITIPIPPDEAVVQSLKHASRRVGAWGDLTVAMVHAPPLPTKFVFNTAHTHKCAVIEQHIESFDVSRFAAVSAEFPTEFHPALLQLFVAVSLHLDPSSVRPEDRSAALTYMSPAPPSRGTQTWSTSATNLTSSNHTPLLTPRAPVGDPLPHNTALPQMTGEAVFVADVEPPLGCLEAAMVTSTHANAAILSIDPSLALALPGVHGYYDHSDLADRSIKGKQRVEDDKDRVFADGLANCVGMAIGIVVAETHAIAKEAAKLVKIEYAVAEPVLSIADAVRREHYHKYTHCIESGDVTKCIADAPHRLTGGLRVGAQEHFYMEPHALLAIPGETYGEMEIVSCTQCVTKSAKCVAGVLGVPEAKVRVSVKRLGGGFGGKETLTIYRSGAIAVAAAKTKRAVRLVMSREDDMAISGQSHPMEGSWEVGFDSTGRILGCDVKLIADAGHTVCCSNVVMDRAQAHFSNAYSFGSFRSEGKLAWTHLPSNTAFRGFGVPQGALICEDMMECVAASLGIYGGRVREANFMRHQGLTPYGQNVGECHTERIWEELGASAEMERRQGEVEEFNAKNRWRKRGISMIPTMYGVNFPVKYLNQASSHVLLYTDGTVLVSHAGVEMGQGLNIKVMQVAAQALGVPVSNVHIAECASDRSHNTSPTAASMGSDLNGMATLNACEIIMEKLRPALDEFPDKTFAEVCTIAYKRQICLGAHGFYASPFGGVHKWREIGEVGEVENEGRGDIFNYFAFGASVAEVEVEVLTGLWEVKRADILMDVGESLNVAIDVGQVEGAFVQGVGRWTMEEIKFDDEGAMTTTTPHSYFIPTAADVPKDFRVTLLGDSGTKHKTAVHSSKAVGEPPFFLSSSVYFAIKGAVEEARTEEWGGGKGGHVRVDAPLTAAKIKAACRGEGE